MTEIDPDEARETADEILSRSEYRERPQSLLSRVIEWVLDRLGELLELVVGGERGRFIGYVVVVLAIAAALYFVWRILPKRWGRAEQVDTTVTTETTERIGRKEWLARAAAADAEGRWDRSVHARYHALTTGLADGDELSADESVTSGAHRRDFAARNGEGTARTARFSDATGRFEDVWFGDHPADAGDSSDFSSADDELLGGRS